MKPLTPVYKFHSSLLSKKKNGQTEADWITSSPSAQLLTEVSPYAITTPYT